MDRRRVVEVLGARSGSGFLLADRLVLTAAHLLFPADSNIAEDELAAGEVAVRLAGGGRHAARRVWARYEGPDRGLDVALLEITTPGWAPIAVTSVRVGQLMGSAEVRVHAFGFPDAAVRAGVAELSPVTGVVHTDSGVQSGRPEIVVYGEPERGPGGASLWAGLSGGPVFAAPGRVTADVLLGVIVSDPAAFASRRLRMIPAPAILADPTAAAITGRHCGRLAVLAVPEPGPTGLSQAPPGERFSLPPDQADESRRQDPRAGPGIRSDGPAGGNRTAGFLRRFTGLPADRTPAGSPERSRPARAADAPLLHVGAPAGGTSFPALPLRTGVSPVVPAADVRDPKMLIARLRFLGKLKPRFLWHTGDDSYDKSAVDAYLEKMRTLAVQDMAALQVFIAATPRVFPAGPGGGYGSASVSNYFARIDRAMSEYVQETGPYARKLPARSGQFRSQRQEAARSKFLSQIKARLPDAGDQAGYSRPAVDRFLSDLRELAVGDIVRLLAFRATAPGFPVVAQGGYSTASVDNFMTRFRRAVSEYVTAVSETI